MAYDEVLAERVRGCLEAADLDVVEKEMFGALGLLHRGNTVAAVEGDELLVRVGPENMEVALARPGVRPMEFRGRTAKGWAYVSGEVLDDEELDAWLRAAWDVTAELPPK
ncbi:RNA methyltransferase [Streptomyces noursei ZPM]|uniref:RNA methyltransferase n=1 Tax=Streptomyces noursei TaxID=1971 RepID=A0A059VMK5_STRNR|nr:TfoX/Sxy family protein [Streptomyces noursei]AKA01206.1 RNA methyltransferase [Streptomyces noursei ZPM]AIA00544.1 RNA methyltransferase TrmH, group 3 [Streptomyces noursei]EOS98920.1 hypothetical protein K530_36528 [Streptomyces noursei CCRC 11814]EXU92414.1 RNA methyltransferase [Streptomyces noursei PD-1]MCZ0970678.1 TfoX/Sxy family protein [Streptomyces noursei]